MVKLVIFDWDGTLFDSIDKICFSMLQAAQLAKAPAREKDDIKNIIGLSLDKAVAVVWPELSITEQGIIIEHYKGIYVAEDQTPAEAYPGVIDVLNQLQDAGVKLAVATGKSRKGLERAMTLTNTKNYFITTRCAGMKSIGVTYGAHHENRLKACLPHALVNDFNQLTTILGL
jgi:phosphoglycolate phosphatase